VDSGYFATVADVGFVGLLVLLALLGRIAYLARGYALQGADEAWLALAVLAAMLIDALTRSSFIGFPSAFLEMLVARHRAECGTGNGGRTPPVSKVAGVGLIGLIAAGTSGVPRYAASLIRALDRLAGEHEDVRLTLVTTSAGSAALEPRSLEVRVVGKTLGSPRAGGRRVLGEQLASATERNDLLHYFDLTGPVLAPWRRFVSTVHDASQPRTYKRIVQPGRQGTHRRSWPCPDTRVTRRSVRSGPERAASRSSTRDRASSREPRQASRSGRDVAVSALRR
jgi:hypothetical protein